MGTSEEMPNIANWKTGSFIPLISQISDQAVEGCSEDRKRAVERNVDRPFPDSTPYFEVLGGAAGGPTSTSWNSGIGLVALDICFSPLELNRCSLAAARSGSFVV
jgi:hypothetical protein